MSQCHYTEEQTNQITAGKLYTCLTRMSENWKNPLWQRKEKILFLQLEHCCSDSTLKNAIKIKIQSLKIIEPFCVP